MQARTLYLALACVAASCTGGYETINTDPYAADERQLAADNYVVYSTLKTMQGYIIPMDVQIFQFTDIRCCGTLCGYLSGFLGWDAATATYNPSDYWTSRPFERVIPPVFAAYMQLKKASNDPVLLAVGDVAKVAVMSRLTDVYGPIPYSQIGADESLTAAYDSQEDIYNQMIGELTAAVNVLTEHRGENFGESGDLVYGGNVVKWAKFANTLKLRLAMRMVYAAPELAEAMAEEAVNHPIGVIGSNGENPQFVNNSINCYYTACLLWGDYRAAAEIVCYMNGFEDPRREAYFTHSGYNEPFVGWRRGVRAADAVNGGDCSNANLKPNSAHLWMNAAEAAFLKAEGALRGWDMGGTAESFYREGVSLSFDQWGVSGAESYLNSRRTAPEDYVDRSGVGYDASFNNSVSVTWDDAASFETKLEQIITQKWIAGWMASSMEAWSEFRRTGYPKLLEAGVNLSGGVIAPGDYPHRLPYPFSEQTNNGTNYRHAVQNLLKGDDNMATRLWWDCNPNTMK